MKMHMTAAEIPGSTKITSQPRPASAQQCQKAHSLQTGQAARVESADQPLCPTQNSESELVTGWAGSSAQ